MFLCIVAVFLFSNLSMGPELDTLDLYYSTECDARNIRYNRKLVIYGDVGSMRSTLPNDYFSREHITKPEELIDELLR